MLNVYASILPTILRSPDAGSQRQRSFLPATRVPIMPLKNSLQPICPMLISALAAKVSRCGSWQRWLDNLRMAIPAMLAILLSNPCLAQPADPKPPVTVIKFSEFFVATPRELKPSSRLQSLSGKRVRLTGFMAKMEIAPEGAFYLTPEPVVCDEAGGGTADLPPTAVRVIVRSLQGQMVPYSPRVLDVSGVLDLGYRVEEDGRGTQIRLTLDQLEDMPQGSNAKAAE
jgi:hypothetical protein